MSEWRLYSNEPELLDVFGSLQAVFNLNGERLTQDPLSDVIRVECAGVRYYVKRYRAAGKMLRRYLGRPRIKSEWQNLRHFARWGIPTAPILAYGLERKTGLFTRGALITSEIANTQNLAELVANADARLRQADWVAKISQQLAQATRTMHDHHFVHNDLKWRNLLVDTAGQLFFIDCPAGSFWWGPFLRHRIIKDLACLDKVAKYQLSRTQRLRFFRQYTGRPRLNAADKRRVRQILSYFEGRE